MNDMAKHGFGFRFQVATETAPQYGSRWSTVLVLVLVVIAVGLLVVPWNSIFPPAASVTMAHTAPATPSPAIPSPAPVPSPPVVQVKGGTGAVCVLPTGRIRTPVEVVKIP